MTAEEVKTLLADMVFDNPPPAEKWMTEDDFDPPYKRGELRSLARTKCIEIEDFKAAVWRWRLTPRGRENFSICSLESEN